MQKNQSIRKWCSHSFIFKSTIVLLLIVGSVGQNVPQSPCPGLFQYSFDGSQWIGTLQIDGLQLGQTVRIEIVLTLLDQLPNSYPGSLDLYLSREDTLQNVLQNKPVLYRVQFPVQNPLPRVTQILNNNRVICSGAPDSGPLVTSIKLEHVLQTTLSGQPLASQSANPMYQLNVPDLNQPGTFEVHQLTGGDFSLEGNNFNTASSIPSQSTGFNSNLPKPLTNRPNQPQTTNTVDQFGISGTVGNAIPSYQPPQPALPKQEPQRPQQRPPINRIPQPFESLSEEDLDRSDNLDAINRVCGTPDPKFNIKPLVVGGQNIKRGSWPWLAAIYLNLPTSLSFQCGGSLISRRLVVTSAHCFYGNRRKYTANDVVVFLGRHDMRNWNEKGRIESSADGVYTHPDYHNDMVTFDADIAVVLLKNLVGFTDIIRPVCLWPQPSTTDDIVGDIGVVVGWGRNEAGQAVSSVPKRVESAVVADIDCIRSNEQFRVVTSNRTFCAGNRDGTGPCSGDSGGGLIINRNNKWFLRGTVSASLADAKKNTCNLEEYVIYVDVSKFLDWIQSFMQI